jgi:hypothetical protein
MSFGRSSLPASSDQTPPDPHFHSEPESSPSTAADSTRQANKKLKHSPDAAIPIYTDQQSTPTSATLPPQTDFDPSANSLLASHRSPSLFDSDLSSTPIDLLHSHPHPDPSAQPSSEFFSPLSTHAATDLSGRVEHMFQEHEQKTTQVAEQKANGKNSNANQDATMSAHSSKNSSRAHSPVDDGAGKPDSEAPLQAGGTTAQPQAKANHTSKSTDPAGQSINEAELEGRFKVIRYLGKGSYGTVFVAEELATGKQVAIKKIPKVFDNQTNAKRLLREIKILRMLGHHNVIGYRGLLAPSVPATFNSLLIVFEFVDTDLAKLLASDQPITNQQSVRTRQRCALS